MPKHYAETMNLNTNIPLQDSTSVSVVSFGKLQQAVPECQFAIATIKLADTMVNLPNREASFGQRLLTSIVQDTIDLN